MRRAGLLFGAGLLVGAMAMYVVRGDNAGVATPAVTFASNDAPSPSATGATAAACHRLPRARGGVGRRDRAHRALPIRGQSRPRHDRIARTQVNALPKIAGRALALEVLLTRYAEVDAPAAAALARELRARSGGRSAAVRSLGTARLQRCAAHARRLRCADGDDDRRRAAGDPRQRRSRHRARARRGTADRRRPIPRRSSHRKSSNGPGGRRRRRVAVTCRARAATRLRQSPRLGRRTTCSALLRTSITSRTRPAQRVQGRRPAPMGLGRSRSTARVRARLSADEQDEAMRSGALYAP